MRYGQIRQYDIANGPGIRATVFVTGCSRRCVNCFNEEYQDFNAGSEWTAAETERLISYLQDDTNSGLTLLGGEPMENAEDLLALVQAVRRAVPEKSIWVYSGFLYEEILTQPARKALLEACDVLVDGPFVDAMKDPGLYFRGSSNQRIIDVAKSREAGRAVLLWPDGR
ncbi:anaerobic ribonucleoside-triphosphate reductase activating protein [Megasphaera butyrica]|uniref:anaerobic ribonucleoside-triphosphate reductase activating protein n=1 Tax=Megasphaera butyrica TaxID=2981791 RepID=UPI00082137BD|nr:anaerobic ribonucleoside-triphosphate reductase activating protein [Megasphaera butyrica]MCU6713315.1 anaerobic ribonucleoside-triphosphate reductase activating protein [Megasphaera butyrica]SCG93973.1 Pyruvate formate-lyase 1-activating enzyme [uncultured Megasphaera sp.]SCI09533.1 Pyruvate formate-lyase 1-activating enzyme [uncultured Ruminococcus sp.]